MQLWLFSQPQPVAWLLHTGKVLPYQLQAVAVDTTLEETELDVTLEETELEVTLEEMELTELEVTLEEVELLLVPPPV